jgi:hypothetical protein
VPRVHDILDDDDLVIEVDGEGVHLDSIDANGVLRLAVAYYDLLIRIANENGEELSFRGLKAVEKCAALGSRPSDVELARQSTVIGSRLLSTRERPPRGLGGAVESVRSECNALPLGYQAKVRIRGYESVISGEPDSHYMPAPFGSLSVRAQVVRVGGIRPRATFKSKSEYRPFTLDIPLEEAARLGRHIYKTVDIVATVARDREGNIEQGRLKEFYPLSKEDPTNAWRDWFRESGIESLQQLRERQQLDDDGEALGDGRSDKRS